MTLDVSAGQAETLRDSSCEQPHGGDVFGNMSSINVVSKRLALQHVIVLCTVIVVARIFGIFWICLKRDLIH